MKFLKLDYTQIKYDGGVDVARPMQDRERKRDLRLDYRLIHHKDLKNKFAF